MKRSHCAWLTLFCTAALICASASAQAPAPAEDPLGPIKAKEALAEPDRAAIQNVVKAQADILLNEKATPAELKVAREKLVDGVKLDPNNPSRTASVAYRDEYANQINKAFVGTLKGNLSLRTRLNIAVLVGQVGAIAQNARLEPTITLLLQDPADPVVMWAMRGASGVVPALSMINVNQAKPLVAAIKAAVAKHPRGAIFAEAYKALLVNEPTVIIPTLLDLLRARIDTIRRAMPDEPQAENDAVRFLVMDVWSKAPQQNNDIIQVVADLMSVASSRYDDPMNKARQAELAPMVGMVGGLFVVIEQKVKVDDKNGDWANNLYKINRGGAAMPNAEPLHKALEGAFGIKPAPKCEPLAVPTSNP